MIWCTSCGTMSAGPPAALVGFWLLERHVALLLISVIELLALDPRE
jgi:hypothetical protein